MDYSFPPNVAAAEISTMVGSASLERGRAYSRRQHVLDIDWDADGPELTGRVLGSGGSVYVTSVGFYTAPSGVFPEKGLCTCPMRANCKHVAALLLAGNDLQREVTAQHQAVRSGPSRWERQLDSMLRPADPSGAGHLIYGGPRTAVTPSAPTPLGLQFELHKEGGTADPGRSRYAGAAEPESEPRVRLGVRPVTRNASGRWVRGQLSWDRLQYTYYTTEYRSDQRRWLSEFCALYSAGQPGYGTGSWLYLDSFNTPLLWHLLAQAGGLGIELVTAKSSVAVVVHDEVSVTMDVRSGDGGLRLLPQAEAGGRPLDPVAIGVLGTPAHGLFWWDTAVAPSTSLQSRNIGLAPVTGPVSDALRSLISARVPLDIPESGRDDFMDTYYPLLHRNTEIGSSDGSAVFPELLPPELVPAGQRRTRLPGHRLRNKAAGTGDRSAAAVPGGLAGAVPGCAYPV